MKLLQVLSIFSTDFVVMFECELQASPVRYLSVQILLEGLNIVMTRSYMVLKLLTDSSSQHACASMRDSSHELSEGFISEFTWSV
jgi:hypothetical protein